MFTQKMQLIERHLKDANHPLKWLQKAFSEQLRDYYQLFLDENRSNAGKIDNLGTIEQKIHPRSASKDTMTDMQRNVYERTIIIEEEEDYQQRASILE